MKGIIQLYYERLRSNDHHLINRWTKKPHLHLRERKRNGYYLNKKGGFSRVRNVKAK